MSIVVAGFSGLVGSAIFESLKARGESVIGIDSKVVNLLDRNRTFEFIHDVRPSVVIDAAAVVGGIGANINYPVDFLSKNLQIQSNLMDASHNSKVERFVFLGSSCIYPRGCPQPMKEEYLLTGPLEVTNSAYAIAKIAGLELIRAYRKQFNHRWISIMPSNIYGPKDNFSLQNGHVLPALINRFVTAVEKREYEVTLWGSGSPRREFVYSQDLAEATILLLEKYDGDSHINVGPGKDIEIRKLAMLIAQESGYEGEILWDFNKPDGTSRKLLDISRIQSLGWTPKFALRDGVKLTINWFKQRREEVRA